MSQYMLDTNICSYVIRSHPRGTRLRFIAAQAEGRIVVSCVTYYELMRGAFGQARLIERVEEFLARLVILPWDQEAAARAARVHGELSAQGRRIGENDTMIAGHALAAGCTLVTNNVREFARVIGLKIEDWSRGQNRN
ncbi:MAG: type II toxin-antitoxin system VapC family toxin [Hyphomicrobiales bacterium]|nr:type II toxin-antitoxin system VapC family toxin [Hyphomicrobiales bacterium]